MNCVFDLMVSWFEICETDLNGHLGLLIPGDNLLSGFTKDIKATVIEWGDHSGYSRVVLPASNTGKEKNN